jgi:hypothetical protein
MREEERGPKKRQKCEGTQSRGKDDPTPTCFFDSQVSDREEVPHPLTGAFVLADDRDEQLFE